MHKSITLEKVMNLVEEGEYIGLCINCGEERAQCEPDARNYHCDNCGEDKVFGAEELLIMLA